MISPFLWLASGRSHETTIPVDAMVITDTLVGGPLGTAAKNNAPYHVCMPIYCIYRHIIEQIEPMHININYDTSMMKCIVALPL